ncbi:MAG: hypothetical protein IT440_10740 [Phycisphaeraceae bacterium]|nr:hypothetical protein [Phycisphaeraceae bacterium]
MSRSSTSSETPRSSPTLLLLLAAMGALLPACVWVVVMAGLSPTMPAYWTLEERTRLAGVPTARFLSVPILLLMHAPLLALIWAAAWGWGAPIRLWLGKRISGAAAVQSGAGMAVMLMVIWLTAWAGLLTRVSSMAILLAGVAMLLGYLWLQGRFQEPISILNCRPSSWLLLLAVPAAALLLVACCCPPSTLWAVEAFGYDVTSYHLQLPREWLALGHMRGLDHNVYSFLPSLGETGYMFIGSLTGSMYEGIYPAQMFHATLALHAAAVLGVLTAMWCGRAMGILTATVVLATPWTIITGSMAYNEWFAMSAAATALLVVTAMAQHDVPRWKAGLVAGFLVGAATMAKLTAGPMVAVPVGLLLLLSPGKRGESNASRRRQGFTAAATATLAGLLTLSPYLIRNAVETGNPVFPFAAMELGSGHWTDFEAHRWQQSHMIVEPWSERLKELGHQWLCNAGYGSIGGWTRVRQSGEIESRNVARFGHEWGAPTLWLLVLLAAGLLWITKDQRGWAWRLSFILAIQLILWLTTTHLQSRFLIWTLLPGSLLLGLGMAELSRRLARLRIPVGHGLTFVLIVILTAASLKVFWQQTRQRMQPWEIIDSLPAASDLAQLKIGQTLAGDHVVNHLPPGSCVYLVADASGLLYIRKPMRYETAFDRSFLGEVIRQAHDDPVAVTASLRQAGITHVWLHLSELRRLMATYGYDPRVTPENVMRIAAAAGWKSVFDVPDIAVLYDLTGRSLSQPMEDVIAPAAAPVMPVMPAPRQASRWTMLDGNG